MDPRWVVRELLTKTIENERQMMMAKLSKGCGSRVQNVILLMSVDCETNVGVADWVAWSGYQGSEDKEESPSTYFTTSAHNLPALPISAMSCSNLCDGTLFQFLSDCVARETISLWDCCKFPCAHANSMVAYPTDTEVGEADPFPFDGN